MEQKKRNSKKYILIFGILSIFTLGIIVGARVFFMVSSKDKKDELKSLASRLLEKPVRVEIDRTKARKLPVAPKEEKLPDEILVDDFDVGLTSGVFYERKNRVGSYQGTWAMRPSFAVITKSGEVRRGDHGQSLVIDYKKEAGWAGWYTLLNGIDVTPYNTLSFWVKGAQGGEKFDIGLADQRMQELEIDAFFLGCVNSFIPGGYISKEWKEVKVPLARVSSEINLSKMGSMGFWFRYGGAGRIYIEDIKFKNDPDILRIEEYNAPQSQKDLLHPRALWVWKIDPVNNLKQRQELFQLCERTNISVLYLYFPEFTEPPTPEYLRSLSRFLTESHKLQIRVEALTGNPVWALSENHPLLLSWIKIFLDYNKDRTAAERIDGVSLDVEPYLTAEWEQDRERIKREYIELLRKCRELIDSYQQDFRLGVAIPFFYDKEDDGQFEKSIFKYVDYIALMDYYDTAKDIIEQARFHIALAKETNRRVIIALETQDVAEMNQGKRRNTFAEEGWEEMETQLEKVKQEFLYEPGFEGFAIHHYDSYKIMTRGRNVPTRDRPEVPYVVKAKHHARPVNIDGKLDDWDLSNPYEVVDKKYIVYGGGECKLGDDLCYRFYTAWDEDALYIAIDVTDDKFIQKKLGKDMWEGDHAEVWFDTDLSGDLNETVNSGDDFQIGLNPGNFSDIPAGVYVWTPVLPEELKYEELIQVASSRTPTGYIVETRIPKEILFANARETGNNIVPEQASGKTIFRMESEPFLGLHKGFRMGIMVDVGDTDNPANQQETLVSTSSERVWGDPTTFGVIELE